LKPVEQRTTKEGMGMKILKIENSLGFYAITADKYNPIDEINKKDLLKLVDLALEQDVEFDEYSEESVKNQAHQIIYKSIYAKLIDLHEKKDEFKDRSDRLFLQEYEKYKGGST